MKSGCGVVRRPKKISDAQPSTFPHFLVSYKEKTVSYKFFPENYEAVLKNIC